MNGTNDSKCSNHSDGSSKYSSSLPACLPACLPAIFLLKRGFTFTMIGTCAVIESSRDCLWRGADAAKRSKITDFPVALSLHRKFVQV